MDNPPASRPPSPILRAAYRHGHRTTVATPSQLTSETFEDDNHKIRRILFVSLPCFIYRAFFTFLAGLFILAMVLSDISFTLRVVHVMWKWRSWIMLQAMLLVLALPIFWIGTKLRLWSDELGAEEEEFNHMH